MQEMSQYVPIFSYYIAPTTVNHSISAALVYLDHLLAGTENIKT